MKKNNKQKPDRRLTYKVKMEALGFRKLQPWVHNDDAEKVLDLAEKLRKKRLKNLQ